MSLPLQENPVAAWGGLVGEQTQEAPADHLLGCLQPGRLEEGGGEVREAHEFINHPPALQPRRPANGQRQVGAGLVKIGLGSGEGHAVVAGHDHQRVLGSPGGLQLLQQFTDLAVESLHFGVVVQQVTADRRRVGQERRDDHVLGSKAGRDSRACLIGPVRVVAPEPEGEGAIRGDSLEELREVPEARPSRIARAASGFMVARPPALASAADHVARLLQEIGIDLKLPRQAAPQVAAFFELVGRAPGEDRRPRRRARRGHAIGPLEQHPLPGQPIKVGRAHDLVAVNAGVGVPPVVSDGEEDAGLRTGRLTGGLGRRVTRAGQHHQPDQLQTTRAQGHECSSRGVSIDSSFSRVQVRNEARQRASRRCPEASS